MKHNLNTICLSVKLFYSVNLYWCAYFKLTFSLFLLSSPLSINHTKLLTRKKKKHGDCNTCRNILFCFIKVDEVEIAYDENKSWENK